MSTATNASVIERLRPRGLAMWRWVTSRGHPIPGQNERRNSNTPIRRRPSVDFSLTGLVYCSMMLFMGLAAINSQANLLFAVFGLMIGILLISAMICRVVLSKLKVERLLPEYASVGQSATIQYKFFNANKLWPSLSVCLGELDGSEAFTEQPHAFMLHTAPGKSAGVPITVIPKRRGTHKLTNFQISTSFPFGFVKRAMTGRSEDTIMIYPAIGIVSPKLLSLCRSAERGGANMKPRRDGSDEFYGVKEFRWGDNPRWIYWKRSARTGVLVSREMVQISPPRLLILVDSFIETPTEREYTLVEETIAMAASLVNRAMDSGMAVGLCAWAGDWITIPPQRGKRHCRDILTALGDLPINRTVPGQQLVEKAQGHSGQDVTPVLFTPRSVQPTLAGQSRGAMLSVSASSDQARSWFHFDPTVDFTRSMPANHMEMVRN
jgi:uncharacterized protein (DUF58 family)